MTSCTVGPDRVHYISAHNTRLSLSLSSRPGNKSIYRTRQQLCSVFVATRSPDPSLLVGSNEAQKVEMGCKTALNRRKTKGI